MTQKFDFTVYEQRGVRQNEILYSSTFARKHITLSLSDLVLHCNLIPSFFLLQRFDQFLKINWLLRIAGILYIILHRLLPWPIRTAWDYLYRANRGSKCHATVIIALGIFQESPLLFKPWIMYIIPFANYRWSCGQVDTKGTDSLASSNRGRSVFILLLQNLTCMGFFLYKDILWFDNDKLRNISSQVEFFFQITRYTKRDNTTSSTSISKHATSVFSLLPRERLRQRWRGGAYRRRCPRAAGDGSCVWRQAGPTASSSESLIHSGCSTWSCSSSTALMHSEHVSLYISSSPYYSKLLCYHTLISMFFTTTVLNSK